MSKIFFSSCHFLTMKQQLLHFGSLHLTFPLLYNLQQHFNEPQKQAKFELLQITYLQLKRATKKSPLKKSLHVIYQENLNINSTLSLSFLFKF